MPAEWLTPSQVARLRGISAAKVVAWIRSGQLEAVNLAVDPAGRPRWRISPQALALFDAARSNRNVAIPQRRRRPQPDDVEEFFL